MKKLMKRRALPTRKKVNVAVECTVCMTTFKHDTTFPAHMKAHQAKVDLTVPIPCPVCSIELESPKSLNPHIKDHHPDKGGCCVECLEFMPVCIIFYESISISTKRKFRICFEFASLAIVTLFTFGLCFEVKKGHF